MSAFGPPVRDPIHGPTWKRPKGNSDFRVTQKFGPSSLSVEPTVIWKGGDGIKAGTYANFHQGIDLGNLACGSQVLASKAGLVDFAGIDGTGNRVVIIDHGAGVRTWYGHLGSELVSVGQSVTAGKIIGSVGTTAATACHLHFAIEVSADGQGRFEFVDPWSRLEQNQPKPKTVTLRNLDGIRLRNKATTESEAYAVTRSGDIIREKDGADLGPSSEPRKYGGTVKGGSYKVTVDGKIIIGTDWVKLPLGGKTRYVAAGLAVVA